MTFNIIDKILRRMRINQILDYIPKNSIVLDYGCGDGTLLKDLIKKNIIIYGIGLDKKAIPYTDDKYIICKHDTDDIDLESNSINCIISLAVLEHLDNPMHVLKELHRILKYNGKIIITTPSPYSKPILELLAFFRIINKDEIDDHKQYFSKMDLKNIFEQANFYKIEKIQSFQFGLNNLLVAEK